MSTVFDIDESRAIAKAIAKDSGLTIVEDRNATDLSVSGDTITIPPPTIYNHKEYMEHLHSAINQANKVNHIFPEGKDDKEKVVLSILKDMHCDKHEKGKYKGRDSQLLHKYNNRKVPFAEVEAESPEVASLMRLGDDLRSQWQGSAPKSDKPSELSSQVGEKWMSLETEEDVRELLKMIEQEESEGGSSDDEGNDEGEGDSSGSESSDQGGEESEGDSGEGKGDDSEEEGEGGEENKDSSGTPKDEGSGQPKEEQRDAKPREGDASETLKDLVKSTCPDYEDGIPGGQGLDMNNEPYQPNGVYHIVDTTSGVFPIRTNDRDRSLRLLANMKLSKRIRKYLLSMIRCRTQIGLRSGRMNPSKITRMYSNTSNEQPRMFKQKNNSVVNTDIAFSILVDHSGSMSSCGKYHTAAACGTAISEVLSAIDISHNITTFSTVSRDDAVSQVIIKKFGERYVSRDTLLNRFHIDDRATYKNNADGESIMWAMSQLVKRPEAQKVLIVLSDGQPAFGMNHGNSKQYLTDVVKSIEEARGVDILGIGILSSAVEHYYTRCEVLNDVGELEGILLRIIKEKVL